MTPLLDRDNPVYLRRLVKVLNDHGGDGFYMAHRLDVKSTRCTKAMFAKGVIRVRIAGPTSYRACTSPLDFTFHDPNGQELLASRAPSTSATRNPI